MLASTLTTAIVFFPVTLLSGVSKFLFSAMALAVVVALFASFFIAMTVVPLYCSKYLKLNHPEGFDESHAGEARTLEGGKSGFAARFNAGFNARFEKMLLQLRGAGAASAPAAGEGVGRLCRGFRRRASGSTGCWASPTFRKPTPASSSSTSRLRREPSFRSRSRKWRRPRRLIKEVVRPCRSRHHCRQHRRRQWLLRHLYAECGHAYRVHPGWPEPRAQHWQLCLHRAHQAAPG